MAILRKLVSGLKVLFRPEVAEKEMHEELMITLKKRLPPRFDWAQLPSRHVAK